MAQLNSTVDLLALLQSVEQYVGQTHSELATLLDEMSRELRLTTQQIRFRVGARDMLRGPRAVGSQRGIDDQSLEALLNALCAYSRATCQRLAAVAGYADSDLKDSLRHMLRLANKGILLIDLYQNAIALRSPLAKLPGWS